MKHMLIVNIYLNVSICVYIDMDMFKNWEKGGWWCNALYHLKYVNVCLLNCI